MKNTTLYIFESLACICVIAIHTQFYRGASFIAYFSRFAVPFFFLISGYFAYNDSRSIMIRSLKKRLKRNLSIFCFFFVFYFIFNQLYGIYRGNEIDLTNCITISNISTLFIFQESTSIIGTSHLWFIISLIYIYVIYICIKDKNGWLLKLSFILITLMYVIQLLNMFHYINVSEYIYRNFLLLGLPMFVFGSEIAKNKQLIIKYFNNKISLLFGIYCVLFGIGCFKFKDYLTVPVSGILLAIILLIVGCKHPVIANDKNILVLIGKKYSKWIYLEHIAIVKVFILVMNDEMTSVKGTVVYILTIIFSILLAYITDKVLLFRNKRKA